MPNAQSIFLFLNCNQTPSYTCWGNPGGFLIDLYASNFIHVTDQYVNATANGRYTVNNTAINLTGTEPHFMSAQNVQAAVAAGVRASFPNGGGGGYGIIYNLFLPQGQDTCFSSTQCYSPDNPSTFVFCAYHSAMDMTDAAGHTIHVVYTVMPYQNVAACGVPQPSPNGALRDATESTLSHEIIELITDPDLNAWFYLNTSGEIGDLCRNDYRTFAINGTSYEVQTEYDNAVHGCSTGPASTGGGTPAAMTTPPPGSTLSSTSVTFAWNAGSGVTQYWLSVGTTSGGFDLYNASTGTTQLATVNGLPANGSTIYVRLWSLIAGTWKLNDYTYTAMTGQAAVLTAPPPGSTLPGTSVTFGWTPGTGVSQYWLYVGTTSGGSDLYNASTGTDQSATVYGLPANGSTIYVRLYSLIGGSWQSNDYTYTAASPTPAVLTTPTPGSTLAGSSVVFGWSSGSGATQYWLYVGSASGGSDLYNSSTGTNTWATASGLPTDGRTLYVRLWSLTPQGWLFNDYTYTATSARIAVVTTPAPGSILSSASATFVWTAGTGVTQYWLYVGSTRGGSDLYDQTAGTNQSATVSRLPTDGRTIYVRLWSLASGVWQYNDYTYTIGANAVMTGPVPQSILSDRSVTFGWSSGSGVSQYWLYVGTTAGGTDLYNQSTNTTPSATVSGLPADGRTLYARLWSLRGGTWQYNDYIYTAVGGQGRPALSSPPPGSTLAGSTATFGWTAAGGVSGYALYVGTTPGGSELYGQPAGANLSANVAGLPVDGRTLYVRLWSSRGTTLQWNDYSYRAGTAGLAGVAANQATAGADMPAAN